MITESRLLFSLDDIPSAELPPSSETEEQQFSHAVNELLNQTFDAFGLTEDGVITRTKTDSKGVEMEHLVLVRKGDEGRLDVTQTQYNDRRISLSNRQFGKATYEIHASYHDMTESFDGSGAIIAINEALSDGTILPPKPKSS